MSTGISINGFKADIMKNPEFSLTIELNTGEYDDWITTCDLTHEYVTINADYRS